MGCVISGWTTRIRKPRTRSTSSPRLSEAQIEILEAQNRAFASIAEAVTPAVVNVGARKVVRVQESPFASDPFFRRFFGDIFGVPREQVQRSLGSGVLVSPEGYIVTNNHVIARADEIKVLLSDRREFPAELIGTDEATEVAVIKVEARGRSKACLMKPSRRLGDPTGVRLRTKPRMCWRSIPTTRTPRIS